MESQVTLSVREGVREGVREFVGYWGAYAPKKRKKHCIYAAFLIFSTSITTLRELISRKQFAINIQVGQEAYKQQKILYPKYSTLGRLWKKSNDLKLIDNEGIQCLLMWWINVFTALKPFTLKPE